jgi:LuxR family maltose regulon positive regulatory protein
MVDLFNPAPVQRARLLLADGEVDQAARWLATRGLDADNEPSHARERELLVLARVLLAQQRPEQARRLLARMGGAAQAQGRTGSLIEVRALEALALDMAGEPAWALAALTQALSLACPEGYVRVFADEGPPMAALLRRLVAAGRQGAPAAAGQVPLDYLGRLLRAVEQQHKRALPASRQATMPGLVEALTARELEVLALLAAGKPNQQIAEELVVTLDTVKKHITHILDKLGAANRMQAVAHARKLGMLP